MCSHCGWGNCNWGTGTCSWLWKHATLWSSGQCTNHWKTGQDLGTFKKINLLQFCIFCFINKGRALAYYLPVFKCRTSCQFVFFQKIHFSRSTLDHHPLSLWVDPQIVKGSLSFKWLPFLSLSVKLGDLLQIFQPKELQPPPQSTKASFRERKCGKW